MKLALMSYTYARQPDFDLARMCRLGQELGIDGVDMVTLYNRPPEAIRKLMDAHGLRVVCYTFPGQDLGSSDPAARRAVIGEVRKAVAIAPVLGTDKLMLVTPGHDGVPRDVTRRNYLAGLREAVAITNAAGLTLTIENFPGEFSAFVTAADVLEAITAAPGLKLTFDNGNAFTGEDPANSFTRCAQHVVHAHFKDWVEVPDGQGKRMLNGRSYRPALIGEGAVNQPACLRAMRAAGYTGYINIEYEGNDYATDEATRRAVAYLRAPAPSSRS